MEYSSDNYSGPIIMYAAFGWLFPHFFQQSFIIIFFGLYKYYEWHEINMIF